MGSRARNAFHPAGIASRLSAPLVARIYFQTGRATIDADGSRTLGALAAHYQRQLEIGIPVKLMAYGFADERGHTGMNERLSDRRARSVVDFLLDRFRPSRQGVRIHGIGFGERFSGPARELDRRVDVLDFRQEVNRANLRRMSDGYRRMAENALGALERGLPKLQEQVEEYRRRSTLGDVGFRYGNLLQMERHRFQLDHYRTKYRSLLQAIREGDEAFSAWMHRQKPNWLQEDIRILKELRLQVSDELRGVPPEPSRLREELNDEILWLNELIRISESDLASIVPPD